MKYHGVSWKQVNSVSYRTREEVKLEENEGTRGQIRWQNHQTSSRNYPIVYEGLFSDHEGAYHHYRAGGNEWRTNRDIRMCTGKNKTL